MFSYISLRSYSSKDNLYINLLDLELIRILLSEHFRNISITKARRGPAIWIHLNIHLYINTSTDWFSTSGFTQKSLILSYRTEFSYREGKVPEISLTFSISFGLGLLEMQLSLEILFLQFKMAAYFFNAKNLNLTWRCKLTKAPWMALTFSASQVW